MCEVAPGPRCWSDSCKTMNSYMNRLARNGEKLTEVRSEIEKAEISQDFRKYTSLRNKETKILEARKGLVTDARHAQRDIDGTKTGRRQLEAAMARTDNDAERKKLENRIRAGEALRFCRDRALAHRREPRVPALFI